MTRHSTPGRSPALRRTLPALLLAFAASPPALAAGKPCNDCCQLPCVEAEIRYATKMQQFYRTLQSRQGLTQDSYEAAEKARAIELSKERSKGVGNLAACKWNLPDPKTDVIAVREWSAAGWSIKSTDDGVSYDFTLKANPQTCTLREKQVTLLEGIVPCAAMADATEKHERLHVSQCEARKGAKETLQQTAADEVAAYDVELKALGELREVLRKACAVKSCKDNDANAASARLKTELDELQKHAGKRGAVPAGR